MYLIAPYLLFRLFLKGRHNKAYQKRMAERFGYSAAPIKQPDIWVHAVSLGETIAIIPLLERLLSNKHQLLITSMTPTGAECVLRHFGDRVLHRYIPYDMAYTMRRFYKNFRPKIGIIVETELWPNLINEAHKAHIPLCIINARLSPQSYRGYHYIAWFMKPLLSRLSAIYAQSHEDALRFKALGAPAEWVITVGNMKFDLPIAGIDQTDFLLLKQQWGSHRPVLILASTHAPEEQLFLSLLHRYQQLIPDLLLVIAPRHPERFSEVIQLSEKMGFSTAKRTEPQTISTNTQVLIANSLGELLGFYACSDYAFVGGSLVPVGGHNILEPIAMGIPVMSGQHVHNFKAIIDMLLAKDAIILVDSAEDVYEYIRLLMDDNERRALLIHRANLVFSDNKGALDCYVNIIEQAYSRGSFL